MSARREIGPADSQELVAVRLAHGMPIRPAPVSRPWMETAAGQFAKRCLPLLIANQAGWELLNPSAFTAQWEGHDDLSAVKIWPHVQTPTPWVTSHFGSGILTFHIPYVFRSPRGLNLHVRGPVNAPKDGIGPLEGIVETDWTTATFTMNWKFTRPYYNVTFEAGEPIATIVPVRRGELEALRPVVRDTAATPELFTAFQRFSSSRLEFLEAIKTPGSAEARAGWQRDYMQGRNVDGTAAPEHQTRLQLQPFLEDRQAEQSGKREG